MSNKKSQISVEKQQQGQESRSASTRDKILDATYRILRELGHTGLRSANISLESGVSRGGLLHHYPTKEALVAAVFERITDRMEDASWKRINSSSDDMLPSAIVDDARSRFFDDSYKILLDILIASAKEKPLADVRKALANRHQRTAREGWAHRLASTGIDAETAHQITQFLWNMVKGLAVRNLVQRDEALCQRIIELGLDLANRRCMEARQVK